MKLINLILILSLSLLWNCQDIKNEKVSNAKTVSWNSQQQLSDYWYQGKAELSTYELKQNRYNGVHPGELICIFVSEDFLTDKQVKNDNYTNPNATPILKSNIIRRFTTGIYDYAIMSSTFTPVNTKEFPHTLKVTTSAQDWCGQSWMQINKKSKNYQMQLRSYFENEGDQSTDAPLALLEDEIPNRIRMNPGTLPIGEIDLLPANHFLRLLHLPFTPVKAIAEMAPYSGNTFEGEDLMVYQLEMPKLKRKVQFVFQKEAPYLIEGWEDSYPSAFDKQIRSTVAVRKHTQLEPYWQQNSPEDADRRDSFGLK